MTAPIADRSGIVHSPGCEWLCGPAHGTTWRDYECRCTRPTPSKARGQRGMCSACQAAIPEPMARRET